MPPTGFGTVSNKGPGAVCQVCALGPEADAFARNARTSGHSYIDIAQALEDGFHARHKVSPKSLWHHANGHRGRTRQEANT